MDLKKRFENLVTNIYMDDFNYRTCFKFKTVFYKSPYSYCVCPCAFEHEFLDYIDDTGEINKEIYEKIADSILDGKCPHVTEEIQEEKIKVTSVTGLQVAIAVGTKGPKLNHITTDQSRRKGNGVFELNLQNTALIKNKYKTIVQNERDFVYLYSRSTENPHMISVQRITQFEAIVHTKDNEWLKTIFKSIRSVKKQSHVVHSINKALKYTVKEGLVNINKTLIEYARQSKLFPLDVMPSVRSAIVYNKPEILDQMLDYVVTVPKDSDGLEWEITHTITEPCVVLKRSQCKEVILNHHVYDEECEDLSDYEEVRTLFYLLEYYYDDFKDEITEKLHQSSGATADFTAYFGSSVKDIAAKPKLVKLVLELGADISKIESTIFLRIIQTGNLYNSNTRETVKALVNANPDLEKNGTVVPLELEKDKELNDIKVTRVGTYLADVREHGLFGHDGKNFALNFSGPFFIECGFPVKREKLEKNLSDERLHPAIRAYIKDYIEKILDSPKPLVALCREVLRKHFKGQAIHRFIERIKCPQRVKDFVLMKTLLDPIDKLPNDELNELNDDLTLYVRL